MTFRKLFWIFFVFLISLITVVIIILRPSTETDTPDTSKREQVNLRFTYWGSIEEKKAIENAMEQFTEQYPWISVEPIQIPNADYNTKLMSMSASNEEPDLGYMTTDLGEAFAKQNKFINLYKLLDRDPDLNRQDFLDYLWYESEANYAWGVSTAAEAFGLFYRKDIFYNAGVMPPPSKAENAWTWEEFIDVAKRLTMDQKGRNAYDPNFDKDHIEQYGVMFETWSEPLNNFIFSNGGDWVDPTGEQFIMNQAEAAEALQLLADLMNKHHVAPSPFETKSLPAMNVALQAGMAAMIIDGQWINLDLGKAEVDFDIGVLPKMKKSITVGLSGATVLFKSSMHPEEAWLLFKWLSDPSKAIELYTDGLWMPTRKEWYTNPELISRWVDANPAAHPPGFKDAMMAQLIDHGIRGVGYYLEDQSEIFPIVTSGLYPLWLGEKSAQEVLDEIALKVQPYFEQP